MPTYSIRHAAAMAGGLACIAAETVLNITHVYTLSAQWWLQPLVLAIGVAGVAQAIAASITTAAFRERRWINGIITAAGLIAAITFAFTTSYIRVAETGQERRLDRDSRLNAGKRAIAGRVAALQQSEKAECTTVGPECRKIRGQLVEARAALSGTGGDAVEVNVLGVYAIVPELALPLMLLLLGLSLIAYAEAPIRDGGSSQTSFPADDGPLPGKDMFSDPTNQAAAAQAKAAKVANFAAEYQIRHGRRPSVRTISKAIDMPTTTVHRALKRRAG